MAGRGFKSLIMKTYSSGRGNRRYGKRRSNKRR